MDDTLSLVLATDTPEQTRRAAGVVASLLRLGDVVALSGDLGAGKTCFVQGAAAAMGVTGRVTSPTFVLVRQYLEATLPIVHCDVYRLDNLQDVDDLGDEVMSSDMVTFLEWSDAVASILPPDRLDVELLHDDAADLAGELDGPGRRRIILRGRGEWAERWPMLSAAVTKWTV